MSVYCWRYLKSFLKMLRVATLGTSLLFEKLCDFEGLGHELMVEPWWVEDHDSRPGGMVKGVSWDWDAGTSWNGTVGGGLVRGKRGWRSEEPEGWRERRWWKRGSRKSGVGSRWGWSSKLHVFEAKESVQHGQGVDTMLVISELCTTQVVQN